MHFRVGGPLVQKGGFWVQKRGGVLVRTTLPGEEFKSRLVTGRGCAQKQHNNATHQPNIEPAETLSRGGGGHRGLSLYKQNKTHSKAI